MDDYLSRNDDVTASNASTNETPSSSGTRKQTQLSNTRLDDSD
jgi:hypothetical protein